MNNKGFSLIEMLATVVILGVLGTIAVVGTTKYINKSRKKAYIVMSQSIYEAAMNCQTKGDCTTGSYGANNNNNNNFTDLVDLGYLDELKNPISGKKHCEGIVHIRSTPNSTSEYKKYSYEVELKCPGLKIGNESINQNTLQQYGQKCFITWPDYKSDENKIKCS